MELAGRLGGGSALYRRSKGLPKCITVPQSDKPIACFSSLHYFYFKKKTCVLKNKTLPGVVAHSSNPNTPEARYQVLKRINVMKTRYFLQTGEIV